MVEISQWTYNDSRAVRIATVIALIYVPANLVLVSHVYSSARYQNIFLIMLGQVTITKTRLPFSLSLSSAQSSSSLAQTMRCPIAPEVQDLGV